MSAQSQPRLTPEQYIEIERTAEFRSEYFAGRMYAMAGGSYPHAMIIGNLVFGLKIALGDRPCSVAPGDLRVRVSEEGLYTYPDLVVVCGEPDFADGQKDTLVNPTLVAEVLSPSTEAYDRGFKSAQYRKIPSLKEYVLVAQTEPRIEVFRRQASGTWLLSEWFGLDSVCRLESPDCSIALAGIYRQLTFSLEEVPPPRPPAR